MPNAISRVNPTTLPDAPSVGYSQITVAQPGTLAYVSGQVAWTRDSGSVPETLEEQTKIVILNAQHALDALNATPHDIVMVRIYMTDLRAETQALVMEQLLAFLDGAQPSLTGVGVTALGGEGLQLEMELVVRLPD